MKTFGKQTYRLLDNTKPYQRPELRHAGTNDVNREAELDRPSRVACSDLLGDFIKALAHTPRNSCIECSCILSS
jgi:hypothetical protein